MEFRFTGEVWFWRGPSPFHFVTVAESAISDIKALSPAVTYGWGMVPCEVSIGETDFTTSLWPKDGGYILPLKSAVRRAEDIEIGDVVEVSIVIE